MIEAQLLTLARSAVEALKWEVTFSPKPGLVDAYSNGSHTDMDADLFLKSAESLLPSFTEIATYSSQHPIDIELREEIGRIGRVAENDMYGATGGVNTHKGAIWTFGLLISVIASRQSNDLSEILLTAKKLANLPDQYAPKSHTHGQAIEQKYALTGAKGEAQQGFPNISRILAYQPMQNDFDTWIKRLLVLYSVVDDTNVVYRSNLHVLRDFQKLSSEIAHDDVNALNNPKFQQLIDFTKMHNISPGGCADLFAASYFLQQLNENGEKNGKITF